MFFNVILVLNYVFVKLRLARAGFNQHGKPSLGIADRAKNFLLRVKMRRVAVIEPVPDYVTLADVVGVVSGFTVADEEKLHALAVLVKDFGIISR